MCEDEHGELYWKLHTRKFRDALRAASPVVREEVWDKATDLRHGYDDNFNRRCVRMVLELVYPGTEGSWGPTETDSEDEGEELEGGAEAETQDECEDGGNEADDEESEVGEEASGCPFRDGTEQRDSSSVSIRAS